MTTTESVKITADIEWFDFLEEINEDELSLVLYRNPHLLLKFTQEPLHSIMDDHPDIKLFLATRLTDEEEWRIMLAEALEQFSRNRARIFTFDKDKVDQREMFKYYIEHCCFDSFNKDLSIQLENNFSMCRAIINHMEKFGMKWRDLILEKHGLRVAIN